MEKVRLDLSEKQIYRIVRFARCTDEYVYQINLKFIDNDYKVSFTNECDEWGDVVRQRLTVSDGNGNILFNKDASLDYMQQIFDNEYIEFNKGAE